MKVVYLNQLVLLPFYSLQSVYNRGYGFHIQWCCVNNVEYNLRKYMEHSHTCMQNFTLTNTLFFCRYCSKSPYSTYSNIRALGSWLTMQHIIDTTWLLYFFPTLFISSISFMKSECTFSVAFSKHYVTMTLQVISDYNEQTF